ncbi:MAG: hypothetical protein R3E89_02565 [Thiolinea sp.]
MRASAEKCSYLLIRKALLTDVSRVTFGALVHGFGCLANGDDMTGRKVAPVHQGMVNGIIALDGVNTGGINGQKVCDAGSRGLPVVAGMSMIQATDYSMSRQGTAVTVFSAGFCYVVNMTDPDADHDY